MTARRPCPRFIVGLLLMLFAVGCEGGPAGLLTSLKPAGGPTDDALAVEYRQQYQTERDPQALRWLLVNRVRQGMSVSEIGEILGQDGEREYEDNRLKAGNSSYRSEDKAYRWGPDSDGKTIFLIFREDQLLNYDPQQFADDTQD